MFALRFALTRCALLFGLLVLPLALVALGADEPADAKKPAAESPADKKTSESTAPGKKAADEKTADPKSPADAKQPADETPPPKKMVHASLLVHVTEQRIWPTADNKIDFEEFRFYKASLAAQLKSSLVINKALEDASLKDNPLLKQHRAKDVEWVADELVVDSSGNGELMTIGMASDDPKAACEIVNAVVGAFMKEVVEKERTDRLNRLDNFNRKYSSYRQQLLDKRRELFTVSKQLGISQDSSPEQRRIARAEKLADDARRSEWTAELQTVRAKHKAEGLAETSAEFKAAQSEADMAEIDRKFWHDKSDALSLAIGKLEDQHAANSRFSGDVELLSREIEQLQADVNEMGSARMRLTIELDAEPRVRVYDVASAE